MASLVSLPKSSNTSTPCGIERLPQELLDQILDDLDRPTICRLMRCSAILRVRAEPCLLKTEAARNLAMKWACTRASPDASATVLRRLVRHYGVSASVVEIIIEPPRYAYHRRRVTTREVFTGGLAVRAGRADVVSTLARLGARLDDPVLRSKRYRPTLVIDRLFASSYPDWDLIRAFVQTGWPRKLSRSLLVRLLVQLILAKSPLDLIDSVIDLGADLNLVIDFGKGARTSPLAAAVLVRSPVVFRRLILQGADVSTKLREDRRRISRHCPLSLAVEMIPEHGLEMLDMCLQYGADVNRPLLSLDETRSKMAGSTPLARYLSSVAQFSAKEAVAPAAVVQYLLDKGASVQIPRGADQQSLPKPPLLIGLLLDNLQDLLKGLAETPVQDVIKVLVQHGAADGCVLDLVIGYEYLKICRIDGAYCERCFKPWRDYLDIITQVWKLRWDLERFREVMDVTLHEYIRHQITDVRMPGTIAFVTIHHLVRMGADINARVGDEGCTALHAMCHALRRANYDKRRYALDLMLCSPEYSSNLIDVVLDQGADPNLKTTKGETAVDILRAGTSKYSPEQAELVTRVISMIHDRCPLIPWPQRVLS